MIPFNLDDIMDISNNSSYQKGEDYYENGCVKKIIKKGNKFEGKVIGSSAYKVRLDISNDEINFNCSCPYDYDGICKHSVAFAMAVLEGEYVEETIIDQSIQSLPSKVFDEHYRKTDNNQKLNFLKQLLDKDIDLQNQFMAFCQSKTKSSEGLTLINIDEVRKKIYDELTSIDFDAIVEDSNPYDYDYYNDEGYIDDALEEIRKVIASFNFKAINFSKKGNLTDSVKVIMGIYEGIQNLPDVANAEYEIFGDTYEKEVFEIFKEELTKVIQVIEHTIKTNKKIEQIFDLLFQRFEFFENQLQKNGDGVIQYDMKVFEKLLINLIVDKTTADYLYNLIKKNNLICVSMAFVILKIAEVSNNEQLWIEIAESFAEFESDISKQLLVKYKKKQDLHHFNRIAKTAFTKWPAKFSLYLIENIDKESENELFVNALKYHTKNNKSIKYYSILRNYLSEAQRINYIETTKNDYDDLFYIQLLEIEKRYVDILTYIRKMQTHIYVNDFEKILTTIANVYSEECFDIIKNKCNSAIKLADKNRNTYKSMAKFLKVMTQIISKQKEAKEYIISLYNHKPNLPALKDELRLHLGVNYMNQN